MTKQIKADWLRVALDNLIPVSEEKVWFECCCSGEPFQSTDEEINSVATTVDFLRSLTPKIQAQLNEAMNDGWYLNGYTKKVLILARRDLIMEMSYA